MVKLFYQTFSKQQYLIDTFQEFDRIKFKFDKTEKHKTHHVKCYNKIK